MIVSRGWKGAAVVAACAVAGCKGEARSAGPRTVTLSWQANHEKGVNGPGGGYRVAVDGHDAVVLPWPAPTTVTTVLSPGSHAVSVEAFEPDPTGVGTAWSPPAALTVVIR